MIHIKYCKRCNKAFDIGTNYSICPECRKKLKQKEERINEMSKVQKRI